jgi:DNA-binding NarL/FixJ family response regulator
MIYNLDSCIDPIVFGWPALHVARIHLRSLTAAHARAQAAPGPVGPEPGARRLLRGYKVQKIRVMLVDDHALVREGTRELLEREEDLAVVAEAGDGQEAIQLAMECSPDVILMDVALPKLNGLEATRRIKAVRPAIAVLVLSAYDDDEYILAFLEAGAAGYMLKEASAEDLVRAIRAVHAGDSVLHPTVTRKVIDHFQRIAKGLVDVRGKTIIPQLTPREIQVLRLVAKGLTNREVAAALSISPRTVQVHMSNVTGKLGVGSRTEAVLYAVREGWISLEDTM